MGTRNTAYKAHGDFLKRAPAMKIASHRTWQGHKRKAKKKNILPGGNEIETQLVAGERAEKMSSADNPVCLHQQTVWVCFILSSPPPIALQQH